MMQNNSDLAKCIADEIWKLSKLYAKTTSIERCAVGLKNANYSTSNAEELQKIWWRKIEIAVERFRINPNKEALSRELAYLVLEASVKDFLEKEGDQLEPVP